MFQDFLLIRHLTAIDNVRLPALFSPGRVAAGAADALISRFHVSHRRRHPPGSLSRDEMQRITLARTVVGFAGVLLLAGAAGCRRAMIQVSQEPSDRLLSQLVVSLPVLPRFCQHRPSADPHANNHPFSRPGRRQELTSRVELGQLPADPTDRTQDCSLHAQPVQGGQSVAEIGGDQDFRNRAVEVVASHLDGGLLRQRLNRVHDSELVQVERGVHQEPARCSLG
ncbi:MAG: hypothetical protein ABIG68_09275 [Acidobacteriota bacterium]